MGGRRKTGIRELEIVCLGYQMIRKSGNQAVREKIEDGGQMAEKRRISNIHRKVSCGGQGISNCEVEIAALRSQ